jgi:hypothetical protein
MEKEKPAAEQARSNSVTAEPGRSSIAPWRAWMERHLAGVKKEYVYFYKKEFLYSAFFPTGFFWGAVVCACFE